MILAANDPRFIPSYPLDHTGLLQPNDTSDDSAVLACLVGRASAEGLMN